MNYNVVTIPPFDRQLKRLAKKYPSLKTEYQELVDILQRTPNAGTPIGNDCYKIRIAISSKGKGKSAGARVITNIVVAENNVYLLSIYDKSEKDDLSDKEILQLINRIPI